MSGITFELAAGHFDGDGCTFPTPGHFLAADSELDDAEPYDVATDSDLHRDGDISDEISKDFE